MSVTVTVKATDGATLQIVLPLPVIVIPVTTNYLLGNGPGDYLLDLNGNRMLAE